VLKQERPIIDFTKQKKKKITEVNHVAMCLLVFVKRGSLTQTTPLVDSTAVIFKEVNSGFKKCSRPFCGVRFVSG